MDKTITLRSTIHKHFPTELLIELDKLTTRYDIPDNNIKSKEINRLLDKFGVPYATLGNGTNRYGILVDGYALKIALDRMGKIDNRREFKYSARLQPDVVKVYEATTTGLIAVTEYVTIFSIGDFYDRQPEMREILSDISQNFLIGDIGISANNYINWGTRRDNSICILDFAYIYALSYKNFRCRCELGSIIEYDQDFNLLICPTCGRRYTFGEIRKTITKADEEAEIGNIGEGGYILLSPEEEVKFDPAKSHLPESKIPKNDKKEKKKNVDDSFVVRNQEPQNYDLSVEEQSALLNS